MAGELAASQNPAVCGFRFCQNCWWAAGSKADCGVLILLRCPGDRRGPARSHGVDAENRHFSSVFEPSGIAEAFSESKCLCLNFEVRVVRSIEAPVSKLFRPRGFFVREPRHPAKTRDVTPVFSDTYAHTATTGVSLPPIPHVEKTDAGAAPGARNSRKSRPQQRHPGSGLYGASGSLERFQMAEMDLRVMGNARQFRCAWTIGIEASRLKRTGAQTHRCNWCGST